MIVLLFSLALSGCTVSLQPSGPTYIGADYSRERLSRIADDPSEAGAREAVRRWIAHPEWQEAREAVLASVPSHAEPVEQAFARLDAEQQKALIAHLGTVKSGAASAMLVRLSAREGSLGDAIIALAGREDNDAIDGLLAFARQADLESGNRVAAVRALVPATSWRAQSGLLETLTAPDVPEPLRLEIVTVLAPYTFDATRAAMVKLVESEDTAVSARVLEQFDAPRNDAERSTFLGATARTMSSAAAVVALDRAQTLPDDVRARFLTMVEPGAVPSDAGLRAGRVAAAAAFTGRGDAAGGPALLDALDDGALRARAADALDHWIIEGLPTLRELGPKRGTSEGRAEVARLLARYGGPSDADAIGALAAPAEREALLDALRSAPYTLFPSGTVRYAPAATDTTVVAQSLAEAIGAGRALRKKADDANLAYIGAARAYLAGARSAADREALEAAAIAARATFAVWVRDDFGTTDWRVTEVVQAVGRYYADAFPGTPLTMGPPSRASLPAVSVGGSIACTGQQRTEREALPNDVYVYTLRIENPERIALQRVADTWPYDQRAVTSCTNTCACNVPGQGLTTMTLDCGVGSVPDIGQEWCNCTPEIKTTDTPGYAAAKAAAAEAPRYIDQPFSVPMQRVRVTEVQPQQCSGALRLAIGADVHTAALSFGGEKRDWKIEGTATPLDEHGSPMSVVQKVLDTDVTDDRAERRAAALSVALTGYRPTVDQLRRMYGAAVGGAVAAGDLRAARDALLWAEPGSISTTAPDLQAFRERWFSEGARAFPTASP